MFFLDASGMAASTLTVTYISTLPSTTSTATLTIRSAEDQFASVRNLFLSGGFWTSNAAGTSIFIPWSMITLISAQ